MTEVEMAYKAMDMDVEKRNELLLEELPRVRYLATRIHERLPKHVPLEDLVNAGVLGLIEACRTYDPSKSVQFKTFASFRIRGAILDSLRELDWGSRTLRRKSRDLEDAYVALEKKLGRQPSDSELAEEMKIELSELYSLTARLDGLALVSQQVSSNAENAESLDLIESAPSREENAFDILARHEMKEQIASALSRLTERERLVISLYYTEEMTMKEISLVLGTSESRVSQLHSLALVKLRAVLGKTH